MPGGQRHRAGTALVTGCAGFVGSHLCERLVTAGWSVRGLDALTDYYDPALKRRNLERLARASRFSFTPVDLAADAVEPHVAGADVIFHLAGQPGVRSSFGPDFELYVRRNVLATQRLLEAAATAPPRAFVYASSSSVYGDAEAFPTTEDVRSRPVSPYGMTKVATEELAATYWRTAGVPTVGMRYFTVYGPRQRPDMAFHRFVEAALDDGELVVLGDGRQIRDFTYVADAVDATIAAAIRGVPGSVYNVGGGTPVPLIDVVDLLGRLVGRELRIVREDRARGDVRRTMADTTRARRELGYRPRWDVEQGLAVQVQHAVRARRTAPAAVPPAPVVPPHISPVLPLA
jgi:nucleoside-diphosphate-sugar epimerase